LNQNIYNCNIFEYLNKTNNRSAKKLELNGDSTRLWSEKSQRKRVAMQASVTFSLNNILYIIARLERVLQMGVYYGILYKQTKLPYYVYICLFFYEIFCFTDIYFKRKYSVTGNTILRMLQLFLKARREKIFR